MKMLDVKSLPLLSHGASILGSGGGGDAAILFSHLHYLLDKNGPVTIIDIDELAPEAVVIPLALIGAPLISLERIPNLAMFINIINKIKLDFPEKTFVLMPAEIGGSNALTPFLLASALSLPVLDADLIGRAFPKLNMCKPAVLGKAKQVSYLSSPFGDCLRVETNTMAALEEELRDLTVQFGSSAAIATFLFQAKEVDEYVIPQSISRAMEIGEKMQATYLGSGWITEVNHEIQNGFLMGHAVIKQDKTEFILFYQNEYLCIQKNGINAAESPSIIALIESRSGVPISSEALKYGLQVDIFILDAPAFWLQPDALSVVNLSAFDLNIQNKVAVCID